MKKLLFLLISSFIGVSTFAQDITIHTEFGYAYPGGAEIDLNNDGHLDLIIGGLMRPYEYEDENGQTKTADSLQTQIFMYDPATKAYKVSVSNDLNIGDRPYYIFADIDGDGILDLVAAEHRPRQLILPDDHAEKGQPYQGGIYKGNGDGTFTKVTPTFDDASYSFHPVAVDVADFNNDGRADIVAIGYYKDLDENHHIANAVLINQGDFRFKVTNRELFLEYELALATVKAFDYDNDGFMDFIVMGNYDNHPSKSGKGEMVFTDIFRNWGVEEPGEFYPLSLGDLGAIKEKGNGNVDIADFDNDGYLDIVLHGEGEPVAGNEYRQVSRMYINNSSGVGAAFREKTQPQFYDDLRPLNSTPNATRAFDWNGDGHYDLFIPGWCPEVDTQAGFLFTNDGTGLMSQGQRVPGGSEVGVFFIDWNADGTMDYLMSGQSWDATYFPTTPENVQGRTAAIMTNPNTKPARPAAPAGINAAVNGNNVTLSWTAASGAMNNTSYEYFVRKVDGSFHTSYASHVGGSLDGVRKVLRLGNANLNKEITLSGLSGGNYECGVQAINAAYEGSVFVTTTFTIEGGSSIDTYKNSPVTISGSRGGYNVVCDGLAAVEVYNAAGTLLNKATFNTSYNGNLSAGIYIVKVTTGDSTVAEKIVVQ